MFICKEKMNPIPNFFFEPLQTCYFKYFESACSCISIMILSPCMKLWSPKCWNQLIGNFDVYLYAKSQLNIVKTLQTCYFGNFENAWPFPSKIILWICRKLSCLSACKKSTLSINSLLTYCKEKVNLFFFWINWACLATHT